MNTVLFFLFGMIFMSIGSSAPGLINLSVAERTIKRGLKAGIVAALGAATIEFIYTFIAIFFIDVIIKNAVIGKSIKWIAIGVFLGLGIFYLLRKRSAVKSYDEYPNSKDYGYGLLIAGMNMLIIPTWIFLGLWLRSNGYDFRNMIDILAISMGAATGAFITFFGYAHLGKYIVNRIENVTKYSNKALGIFFIFLAAFQLIKMML